MSYNFKLQIPTVEPMAMVATQPITHVATTSNALVVSEQMLAYVIQEHITTQV